MSDAPKINPSFSTGIRWRVGLDVVLRTVLVVAVVVMVNYLGARFFQRLHLSSQSRLALSPHTLNVLQALTNRVDITLYYDRRGEFYAPVSDLVNEYCGASKNIVVHTVDYEREPAEAGKVRTKYIDYFKTQTNEDMIIFDYAGQVKVFPGSALTTWETKMLPPTDPKQKPEFRRRPVYFVGEQAFTSTLLALVSQQPPKAYFLLGQGEIPLTDTSDRGFQKFTDAVRQNYINIVNLNAIPNTGVPADCNLLIIAAPTGRFAPSDLELISQYLQEGGRLLVLLGYYPGAPPCGLEKILQPWHVEVADDVVQDFDYATTPGGPDIKVYQFGKHPVVNSVSWLLMQVYQPHPVIPLSTGQSANAPLVTPLFYSSPGGTLMVNTGEGPHSYPLACAVEEKPVAGVTHPRGTTRMIVVGDAAFLGNRMIESGGNQDFLSASLNWLCDRPTLVEGIGPRPVTDWRLMITRREQRELNWLLLGALPGAVLVFGWFVWLVRRK